MNNFDLKKYLAEGKLKEEKFGDTPHPTEVFSDEELDYASDAIIALHKRLNPSLDDDKTMALMAYIEASMTEMY
jgi:hypothetical protein